MKIYIILLIGELFVPGLHGCISENIQVPEIHLKCLQLWQSVTIFDDLCYLNFSHTDKDIEVVPSCSHLRAPVWRTLWPAAPPGEENPASSLSHTGSFNILIDNFIHDTDALTAGCDLHLLHHREWGGWPVLVQHEGPGVRGRAALLRHQPPHHLGLLQARLSWVPATPH